MHTLGHVRCFAHQVQRFEQLAPPRFGLALRQKAPDERQRAAAGRVPDMQVHGRQEHRGQLAKVQGDLGLSGHLARRREALADRQGVIKFPRIAPANRVADIETALRGAVGRKDCDPAVLPALRNRRQIVFAVFRIGNQHASFPPEPPQRGLEMEVALAAARRAKEGDMGWPVIPVDRAGYLPHDDPVLRRETSACHLARCSPSGGTMGGGLKAPPTPDKIPDDHHGHASAYDPEEDGRMLLDPCSEVVEPLQTGDGIHGAVLLVKNHPHRAGVGALTSSMTTDGSVLSASSALGASVRNSLYSWA
jgi:hypothetical protein